MTLEQKCHLVALYGDISERNRGRWLALMTQQRRLLHPTLKKPRRRSKLSQRKE
jgi:hypothetical protein